MSGPSSGNSASSVLKATGCAVTIALAAILLVLVLSFRQSSVTPVAPQRLVQAGPVAAGGPVAAPAPAPKTAAPANTSGGLQFPALTGRVVDAANIIPADVEARLDQKLAALETQSRRQVVVTTLPSLNGYEISDYGYQLGRAWGIGSKDKNDGALLIVAPNDRKVRIEIGYGLEGILTDGLSSLIIQQAILPRFKAGDMPGGIEAGADAMIAQLVLPEEEARKVAAEAQPASQGQSGGISLGTIIFLLFFFFFFILPLLRSLGGGRRYRSSGVGPVIIWGGGSGFGGGGGGSWGGGGGGFSGGGGSFGGGGSSGSW
jgi:uncharacterized protein